MTVVTGKYNLRKLFVGGGLFTYTWLSNWIVSYVFILTPWTLFCEKVVFHTLLLQCTTCLWSPLFSHRATLWDRLFLQYKEIGVYSMQTNFKPTKIFSLIYTTGFLRFYHVYPEFWSVMIDFNLSVYLQNYFRFSCCHFNI